MPLQRLFLFVLSSFLVLTLCNGQGLKKPSSFVLFEDMNAYFNAALLEGNNQITLGSQNRLGAFSEIRELYAIGSASVFKNKTHGLGFALFSEQEGQLITENRLKVSYWKSIQLNPKLHLVFGGQLGLINTSLKGTFSTAGADTWSPDIDFGFKLKTKNIEIGSSVNQIGNLLVQPLSQQILFKQFYSFYAKYTFPINESIDLENYAASYLFINPSYHLKSQLVFNKAYGVGAGIGNQGFLISAFYKTDKILNNFLEIKMAYQNPINEFYSSIFQVFQIQLSYELN